ncbi:MAG TPA: adenosine deaminase [Fimbriimonadaceae bacterium]|jgi:adenosine deaminase
MPKVELHVHLEGSIRPETVLKLAKRNGVALPADTVEGLHDWYHFKDFPHFVQVYLTVSSCIKTADDLELITREFLEGQAAQNILHTEATFTAATIESQNGIPWDAQLAALQRGIEYGCNELGVTCAFIIDIVRGVSPERALEIAHWAVGGHGAGVCALGVSGEEGKYNLAPYAEAFEFARSHGLPVVPHAGETCGAASIWEALEYCQPVRIGHGVRCLEDPSLVAALRDRKIPLEVNPSSNVCLGVFPSLAEHALPKLLDAGLEVTINSDDPPMFDTTLSDEFYRCATTFGWDEGKLQELCENAAGTALISNEQRGELLAEVATGFGQA